MSCSASHCVTPYVKRLETLKIGQDPMNNVADAPDNCEGKRGDCNQRHENNEDKRNRPRHPGLERLLERPDERHAEKRKRYRFQHDASKVKRGRHENHSEEDVNEAATTSAAHG